MNSKDVEIFHNWTNNNKTNEQIQLRTIKARILPMLKRGVYASSDIEEILVSEGYRLDLIKKAMAIDEPTKTAQKVEKGFPKSYKDLAPNIEKVLNERGPTAFVKMLTSGTNPLMKLSKKDRDTFQKIADTAYDNPIHVNTLHAFMEPSIISELAENICTARKIKSNCKVAQKNSEVFEITHKGVTISASPVQMKSTSEKFAQSNYEAFGFPDEYIALAYEEFSPYSRIKNEIGM